MLSHIRAHLSKSGLGALLIKAVVGTAWLRIAGMAFGFLVGVQLARGLGVESYGIYGIAMSIISMLSVPTEFGLPQLVTREVATKFVRKEWGALRGAVWWAQRVVITLSVAVSLIVVAWIFISRNGAISILSLTVLAGLWLVPLVAFGKIQGAVLRGLQEIVKGQIPDALVRPAIYSLFLFLLSFMVEPLSPMLAMAGASASAAIACIVGAHMLRNTMPLAVMVKPTDSSARSWWSSAFPMAITQGMRVVQGNIVIILLGVVTTATSVGLYRIANSILLLVAVPATIFTLVASPIMASLHAAGDHARLQRLLTWVTTGMVFGAIILSLPFLVAGPFLLSKIFAPEFAEASVVLYIMCIGAVLTASAGTAGTLLTMTKHEKRVTRASWISLIILVCLLPPLAYIFGIEGAAVASVASMTVWRSIMVRDCLRILGLDTTLRPLARQLWGS